MRKYTSPKQKVEKYSIKYNLSQEEVKNILNTPDCNLTKEQLKIKYDNPQIGELPSWITYEELMKMINKTTR